MCSFLGTFGVVEVAEDNVPRADKQGLKMGVRVLPLPSIRTFPPMTLAIIGANFPIEQVCA